MPVRFLKYFSFGSLALIVFVLMIATVLEKVYGSDIVMKHIYGSIPMVVLWGLMMLSSLVYIIKMRIYRQSITFGIHFSFALILVGALITHIAGKQGVLHLRVGDTPAKEFIQADNEPEGLPFEISLDGFELKYYMGTHAPMDYISTIKITDGNDVIKGNVSMNKIFTYKNYRFYQSGYDKDEQGTVLSVSYDPYGIALTYMGYGLLLISLVLFTFGKNSKFKALLKHPLLKRTLVVALFITCCFGKINAAEVPSTLSKSVAEEFCNLYVYYNDRICPLQTLAKDFTVKLYGKSSYRGLSAEQVLTGWFFYYDEWKKEPMIKIKSEEVRRLLGIEGNFARLVDFVDVNGYKLDNAFLGNNYIKSRQDLESANEKFNLVSMLTTGSLLKIYPYFAVEGETAVWYSLADKLPTDMPTEQWVFIRNSMNYVAEKVAMNDNDSLLQLFSKIKKYQERECDEGIPSILKFKAEKLYNKASNNKVVAIVCMTMGFIAFILYCRKLAGNKKGETKWVKTVFNMILILVFLYITANIILRWIVCGHVPLSNGFETMQFLAWSCCVLTLIMLRRFVMALPFGLLLCGLAMMVSVMGESNPQITQLMPVLQSPLLSIHVVFVMIAYSLLAFIMLNGITAVILRYTSNSKDEIEYLYVVSRIMLYPAVFSMAIGIFIGAVWANVSWGRYWGWDPKEVWALVTMLIYSFLFHVVSIPKLRSVMFFHWYSIIAFLSVLITYFGVNFFLGGLHSYA